MSKKRYTEKFAGLTPKIFEELDDRHRKILEIFSKYKLKEY